MRSFLPPTVLAVAVGCAGAPPSPVAAYRTGDAEVFVYVASTDEWSIGERKELGTALAVQNVPGLELVLAGDGAGVPVHRHSFGDCSLRAAEFDHTRREIRIDTACTDGVLGRVFLHEVAHSVGVREHVCRFAGQYPGVGMPPCSVVGVGNAVLNPLTDVTTPYTFNTLDLRLILRARARGTATSEPVPAASPDEP